MTTSPTEPLRALVVGSGFGGRIHVPALRAAGFDVVGLVGTDPDRTARRAQRHGIARSFTNIGEAVAETGAVAATVATPPSTHRDVTIEAVRNGCHVICEKPFASNATEARDMFEAAEAAGVVHLVGNEFRWAPDRNLVLRALADGLIGEPRLFTSVLYTSLVADLDAKMPRWWFDADAGGGWLGAAGSHLIDQVRTWLGEFASISAELPTVSDRQGAAEDTYTMRFQMANGTEGVIQHTAGAFGPSTGINRVAGTQGTVWVDGDAVWVADKSGSRQLPVPEDLLLPPAPEARENDPREMFSHLELGPYTRLCEYFRDAITGRALSTAVPAPTFADGLATTIVLDAIRRSAANGGAVVQVVTNAG